MKFKALFQRIRPLCLAALFLLKTIGLNAAALPLPQAHKAKAQAKIAPTMDAPITEHKIFYTKEENAQLNSIKTLLLSIFVNKNPISTLDTLKYHFYGLLIDNVITKQQLPIIENTCNTLKNFYQIQRPPIPAGAYIDRLIKYMGCPVGCFISALIYIDRFIIASAEIFNDPGIVKCATLNPAFFTRFLLTSLVLAAKFFEDTYYSNKYYAKVGGISTDELNQLELDFLTIIDCNLYISPEVFNHYSGVLQTSNTITP